MIAKVKTSQFHFGLTRRSETPARRGQILFYAACNKKDCRRHKRAAIRQRDSKKEIMIPQAILLRLALHHEHLVQGFAGKPILF